MLSRLIKSKLGQKLLLVLLGVLIAIPLTFVATATSINVENHQLRFTIGTEVDAATFDLDYTCDGVSDDVQFQAAVSALPSTGGEIKFMSGSYDFDVAVSRAIDNVIISGVGAGSLIGRNASSPVFSAGSQSGWVFRDFSTDAGGITTTSATNCTMVNMVLGSTFYAYWASNDITSAEFNAPTGGIASYFIAAYDANSAEMARANYVCDNTSDYVEIQAAIDLCDDGGIVFLSGGNFDVGAANIEVDNCTLMGSGNGRFGGHTDVRLTTGYGIRILANGRFHDCMVTVPSGYTNNSTLGGAVSVFPDVADGGVKYKCDSVNGVLRDISVDCPADPTTPTGTGIMIKADGNQATHSNFVELCTFGSITVTAMATGIELYSYEGTSDSWVNGNTFEDTQVVNCITGVKLNSAGKNTGEVNGNVFTTLQIQYADHTTKGIYLTGAARVYSNRFINACEWDRSLTATAVSITDDSVSDAGTSLYNYFDGLLDYYGTTGGNPTTFTTNNIYRTQYYPLYNWDVENHTTDDELKVSESGSIHTNYGDTGIQTITLCDSARVGIGFTFVVAAAYELRVCVASASQGFIVNGAVSTDDGGGDLYISADDEGEKITVMYIATGKWLVTDINGTWTVTQP